MPGNTKQKDEYIKYIILLLCHDNLKTPSKNGNKVRILKK